MKFTTKTFSAFIQHDNVISLGVYNGLLKAYKASLLSYPKEVNIFGLYFFDVLKLITHSMLKFKEIELDIVPKNPTITKKLNTWPYVGYEDIMNGCDLNSKKFGKMKPIKQSRLKKSVQFFLNSKYLFGKNYSNYISLVSPNIESSSNNIWLQAPNIKTNLIELGLGSFFIPQIEDQLGFLKKLVAEVMEKNNHPLPSKLICDLLERHIKADCSEGKIELKIEGDILLLNSGLELENRMLSIIALQNNIPVINIMHGESFGVHDEPVFSELGEQMYSSAILGYGSGVVSSEHTYTYGLKHGVKYIPSNAVNVKRYFKPEFSGISDDPNNLNYVYYPTSNSGASKRYGPFRDTSDEMYNLWQQSLFTLFGSLLKLKSHPKEQCSNLNGLEEMKTIGGSFKNSMKQVDVFVFDYIGTAFSEACASDKPIIYFDLGIRSISSEALISIKERTIYFDIKDGMPALNEIQEKLKFGRKKNTYSPKYSLSSNSNSRVKSLEEGIQIFF